jgi:membrane associated rhomboid family serine protease
MEIISAIPITLTLMAANILASVYAFNRRPFMDNNVFHIGAILQGRQWHRMLTSGFLHAGILHLFVNMYVLFNFGGFVEQVAGGTAYIIIYSAALLGGNLWSLLENRRDTLYTALGASGATSGIVMAFILFRPFEQLMIFPIPFFMPAVFLGLLFVVGSAILARRQSRKIAHEAHLGGALAGILVTALIVPDALSSFALQVSRALGGS